MRTAIVHYWLLNMRGGERVVSSLCKLFPDADIFTLFYDPDRISPEIRSHRITASFLNPLKRVYRHLLPLMPFALEQFDLREYDLVISSESGPAKGVITHSSSRHVCYCHSPMRYLWELYPAYVNEWSGGMLRSALLASVATPLRLWDYATAARVDTFVANSQTVRRRIEKTYRREATVVHPPVSVERFYYCPPQDYFLIASELVAYKQIDYAVRCFARSGRRLIIVGDGPEYRQLSRQAGKNIEFTGRIPDADLAKLFSECRAFVNPGEEDFGITMVEAMASGKPVIALRRGGAVEIVPESAGGVLYPMATEEALSSALAQFDSALFDPPSIQAYAQRFSENVFLEKMRDIIGNQ